MITLPPALEQAWFARGYYGSVSHDVKAIYQVCMGWFDDNPARLWQHPPVEQVKRYVAAIGGVDRGMKLAQDANVGGFNRHAGSDRDPNPQFTVKAANKLALLGLLSGSAAEIEVSGDTALLPSLVGVLDAPDPAFNIVLP